MTNSCVKGKRIERTVAKWLQGLGFSSARRGRQYQGSPESPDVVCVDELPNVHLECKGRAETPSRNEIQKWVFEAESDSGGKPVAVVVVPNRIKPMLIYRNAAGHVVHALTHEREALLWLNTSVAAVVAPSIAIPAVKEVLTHACQDR